MKTHPLVLFVALTFVSLSRVAADEKISEVPPAPGTVLKEATLESVDAALKHGVDFLIADQNPNGSWGGPTRTKGLNIYAPLPGAHHAFRAGASGLALAGLIDAADARPEAVAAVAKGAEWTEKELPKLRRAEMTTTYNAWGHAYGLRAISRLHGLAKTEAEKSKWRTLGQQQVDLVNRYEDINGGWGYLDLFDDLATQKPS
jgi:hypothetical protein